MRSLDVLGGFRHPPVGIPSAVRGTSAFLPLAFHLNLIEAAPLILNPVRRPPPRAHGTCGIHTYSLPVLPTLQLPPPPPSPTRKTSVMCSGAMPANKAPCWAGTAWVSVRPGVRSTRNNPGGAGREGR